MDLVLKWLGRRPEGASQKHLTDVDARKTALQLLDSLLDTIKSVNKLRQSINGILANSWRLALARVVFESL